MKQSNRLILLIWALLWSPIGYSLSSLQLFIDLTPIGGTLRPPPGHYAGPVVINKPITLDGQEKVTIDGEGQLTVLIIKSDKVIVRGLHLTNSGHSHDQVDAGVMIQGDRNLFENNRIDNVLFGIHVQQANHNVIKNNTVSSRPAAPSLRGEGLRMWYSKFNRIESNRFDHVRDLLFTNSEANEIVGNQITHGRIGMEFVFSPKNRVRENQISESLGGIVALYSNELLFESNKVMHIRNRTGSGLSIKGSSKVVLDSNLILHCSVGLTANTPTHPENILYLKNNRFAYNDVAMYFYGEKGGHIIHNNRFEQNNIPVAVSAATSARGNDWRGNRWEAYSGFDQNGDGVGDTPHEIYLYSDRIWMDRPMTKFYRGSPMFDVIDFVERLVPFSEPEMVLADPEPLIE